MTMRPDEYPEGKTPTCDCTRRSSLATVVIHDDPRCARCYEVIEWVDSDERVECDGQTALPL